MIISSSKKNSGSDSGPLFYVDKADKDEKVDKVDKAYKADKAH